MPKTKKTETVEFPSIPIPTSLPPIAWGPTFGISRESIGQGAVRNPQITGAVRAYTAVVGPKRAADVDFLDIQEAIDAVDKLGGGVVLLKTGTYYPKAKISLKSKVSLIGEGPENTILDFTQAILDSGTASSFSGAIEAKGTLVTQAGVGIVLTTGSQTVTGTGTAFSVDGVKEGDVLLFRHEAYRVLSVESNISLTIEEIYQGETSPTATTYKIVRPITGFSLANFKINGTVQSNTEGIYVTYGKDFIFDNVVVRGAARTGIALLANYNFRLQNCIATRNATGFSVDDTAFGSGVAATQGALLNCSSYNNSTRGLLVDGETIQVVGGNYSHNDQGIKLQGEHATIMAAHIIENDNEGVVIEDSPYNKILGSVINGNGGDGISMVAVAGPPTNDQNIIVGNDISSNGTYGVDINSTAVENFLNGNLMNSNTSGAINDLGVRTYVGGKRTLRVSQVATTQTITGTAWTDIADSSQTVYLRQGEKVRIWFHITGWPSAVTEIKEIRCVAIDPQGTQIDWDGVAVGSSDYARLFFNNLNVHRPFPGQQGTFTAEKTGNWTIKLQGKASSAGGDLKFDGNDTWWIHIEITT
ncbi:MAG: right-handed parallel beta-helix repeat-containing protein [Candidatus Nitrosotenuis sp.]